MEKRRGISEIIASVVLIIIVSSLGVLLYNTALTNIYAQQDETIFDIELRKQQAMERLVIVSVNSEIKENSIALNIYCLNYGEIDIMISNAYLKIQQNNSTYLFIQNISQNTEPNKLHPINVEFTLGGQEIQNDDPCYIIFVSERGVTTSVRVTL